MEVKKAQLALAPMLAKYAKECYAVGIVKYQDGERDPQGFITQLIEREQPKEQDVPCATYYCIEQSAILGAIRVRNGHNDEIENVIGHIGYETLPTARGKGVATFLLSWIQQHILSEPVIITCSVDNLASQRVIEKCDGEYLSDYDDPNKGKLKRYRIHPNPHDTV